MQDKISFSINKYISYCYILLFVFSGCQNSPKETQHAPTEMSKNNLQGVHFLLDYPMDEEKFLPFAPKN